MPREKASVKEHNYRYRGIIHKDMAKDKNNNVWKSMDLLMCHQILQHIRKTAFNSLGLSHRLMTK